MIDTDNYTVDIVPAGFLPVYYLSSSQGYYMVVDYNTLDFNLYTCNKRRPELYIPTFLVENSVYQRMVKYAKEKLTDFLPGNYQIIEVRRELKVKRSDEFIEVGFGFTKKIN